jgi:thiamine-monophosphate kinase
MALGEFDLIRTYFHNQTTRRTDVRVGIGDDCALLRLQRDMELAITTDTLVAGVHFLADTDPAGLGHKALAVNLSDLAAMGAEPAWVTLALTLPESDPQWLAEFARGFLNLAQRYGVELVGGDTTRGPLSITVQAMGWVPKNGGMLRSTAKPGDGIYMTGELGLAGLGLQQALGKIRLDQGAALEKLLTPQPRVEAGLALRALASSCIDISDGLAGDLGHILQQSQVGALLDWDRLPLPPCVRDHADRTGNWLFPLTAGDDYELCFTVPTGREADLMIKATTLDCPVTRIGIIEPEPGLRIRLQGEIKSLSPSGYQHFRSDR